MSHRGSLLIFAMVVGVSLRTAMALLLHRYRYDPIWLASVELFGPVRLSGGITPYLFNVAVQFRLFTRQNPDVYQIIEIDNATTFEESNFDVSKPVKVLAHGWYNNGSSPMPMNLKQAYLNVTDANVVVVDWGDSANVNYVWASYNVAQVGRELTTFLDFLSGRGVPMTAVHMIGHSLGAHVVGIAGAFVRRGPVRAITGLDPALPLFTESNKDARLDRHDATHVQVIHTCAGYLGFAVPIGHVDFYPNGGKSQPGCGTDYRGFCAHSRAQRFFSESILSDTPFTAMKCESYDSMTDKGCNTTGETLSMGGFKIHTGHEGVYYLTTNSDSPYAKG